MCPAGPSEILPKILGPQIWVNDLITGNCLSVFLADNDLNKKHKNVHLGSQSWFTSGSSGTEGFQNRQGLCHHRPTVSNIFDYGDRDNDNDLDDDDDDDDDDDNAGRAVSQQAAVREILPEVTLMILNMGVHLVVVQAAVVMMIMIMNEVMVRRRRMRTRIMNKDGGGFDMMRG